jgi:hypothetical protein
MDVVIPWQPGCPDREAALCWTTERWVTAGHTVHIGAHDGPWCKAAAVTNALATLDADRFIVADADVWCEPIEGLDELDRVGWVVPHRLVHRLTPEATTAVLDGEDWHTQRLAQRPYVGYLGGGLVALRRDVWEAIPMDPRFVGWGHEDESWAWALTALIGLPWRGDADLVHLWHPPQPRQTRSRGTTVNQQMAKRYRAAVTDRRQLETLLREVTHASA